MTLLNNKSSENNILGWQNCIAVLGILLFCLLCFYKSFLFGQSIFPFVCNISVNPIKYIVATKLIHGEYPVWSPHLNSGSPLYSGIGILDPLQYLHLIFDPQKAFVIGAFAMICIGGLGMYCLLKGIFLCGYFSSFLGACLFASNPFAGSRLVDSSSFLMPHFFVPWIFYCIYMSVRNKSLFWAALGSIPFSMTYYSGNIQSTAFITTFLLFYVLCCWLLEKLIGDGGTKAGSLVKAVIVLFIASGLLMAAEILPMIQLLIISKYPASDSSYVWKTLLIFILIVSYLCAAIGFKRILRVGTRKACAYALCSSIIILIAIFVVRKPFNGMYSLVLYVEKILSELFYIPAVSFSEERFNYFEIGYWFRAVTLALVAVSIFLKKNIETVIFLMLIIAYSFVPYSLFNPESDRLAFIPVFALICTISFTLNQLLGMPNNAQAGH